MPLERRAQLGAFELRSVEDEKSAAAGARDLAAESPMLKRHEPAGDLGASWALQQQGGPLLGASESEGGDAD